MSRTVAALYDSRGEAELARSRLISQVRARSLRIIGKDTAAAVDSLKIARLDAEAYREGLRRGGHLLVAEVPSGAPAKTIVEILKQAIGAADDRPEQSWGDGEQGVRVELSQDAASPPQSDKMSEPPAEKVEEKPHLASPPPPKAAIAPAPPEEARPRIEEQAHVGERQVVGGGARVRAFTSETPAEEQVLLRDEVVDVERRRCGREVSEEEIKAGGLFTERVFEIAEMREEPVVTKTAVVREELIVRKRIKARTDTVRDTVRHTQVEVEDLPAPAGEAPTFFRRK